MQIFFIYLKSATKPFNVLFACTRPIITELSDKLRLKHPLLSTIPPYPTMRLDTIRCIIPISCRRHPFGWYRDKSEDKRFYAACCIESEPLYVKALHHTSQFP